MDPEALRQLLNEGIQAAKANNRAQAREQLLQVIEADEHCEPAWLWLSAVLDDPGDQLMALERVLAINPRHPQAQTGVAALRQRLGLANPAPRAESESGAAPPPASQAILVSEPPASSADALAEAPAARPAAEPSTSHETFLAEDDPYQCAYCGRPTHPEDERCRHCRRSLLVPGPWRGGGYLYVGLIATGVQLQLALIEALVAYLVSTYPQAAHIFPLPGLWSGNLLLPTLVRAIAWAIVVLLLLGDYDAGYGLAALVAAADLAWAAAGYRLGYLPRLQAEVNAGLGVIIFLIGLMAVISQAQSRQRLRVVPDRGVVGASLLHRRALAYARQGKWALAALHWRRAISRAPAEPLYYKALGRADIRLGRYTEAVQAFKSGSAAAPNDPEFTRLIEKVRAHARSS